MHTHFHCQYVQSRFLIAPCSIVLGPAACSQESGARVGLGMRLCVHMCMCDGMLLMSNYVCMCDGVLLMCLYYVCVMVCY